MTMVKKEGKSSISASMTRSVYNDFMKAVKDCPKCNGNRSEGIRKAIDLFISKIAEGKGGEEITNKKIYLCLKKMNQVLTEIHSERAEEKCDFDFNKLILNYKGIKDGSFPIVFKNQQLNKIADRIENLKNNASIKYVTPEESFDLSLAIIKNLSTDDRVIAVSHFGTEGWPNEKNWISYFDVQVIAAENGAKVERIFCRQTLNHTFKEPFSIMEHHDGTKMIGYREKSVNAVAEYVSEYVSKYGSNPCPSYDLKKIFEQGFMLIVKTTGEKMAVFDHFAALDHYRAHICFDQDLLSEIEKAFDAVKMKLPRLQE
jgi:hypothetical protein